MPRTRGAETRDKILASASRLFALRGHGNTSVRDIAADAKVNIALVSHHFGGKDKLYDACVDAMYDELDGMREELLRALASPLPLEETLANAVAAGFRYSRAHRGAVRLVMRYVIDTGEVPHERRESLLVPFIAAASNALAERTQRSPSEIRLIIQSVLFLTSRYALSSTDELATIAGCPGEPEALVLRRIEEQLGRQTVWMLGLGPSREHRDTLQRR